MKTNIIIIICGFILSCTTNNIKPDYVPNQMIFVKGGIYSMGELGFEEQSTKGDIRSEIDSKNIEKMSHPVFLNDFYISKFEISKKDYMAFVKDTDSNYPCWLKKGDLFNLQTGINYKFKKIVSYLNDNHPIIGITWFNAVNYCNWKSEKDGYDPCYIINGINVSCNFDFNGYRLPTEAEWEYAARGGVKSRYWQYSGHIRYDNVAWFITNSRNRLHIVGQKQPNELNINDMSGNVREWCWDYYSDKYYKDFKKISNILKIDNPNGPVFGKLRTVRGGSWKSPAVPTTTRSKKNPGKCDIDIGFRIVRTN